MNNVKEHLKKGFETFSIGTSFHGFAELYTAKTSFWVICWISILVGSFGVTIYQVNNAIALYIAEPTSTTLLPANEEDIIYPPLQFCFMTWLFWVDWRKVTSLEIDKKVILYGLNYFNGIFSSDEINMTETEINFQRMMVEKNFSTIFDFYKAISRTVPVGDGLLSHFDEFEIVFKYPGYLFCYKMSKVQMKKYFSKLPSAPNEAKTFSFNLPDDGYQNIADHVTKEEYTQQMVRWVQVKSMYVLPANFTGEQLLNFTPPIVLFPNSYDFQTVDIQAENDFYTINFDATVRTLKNNDRNVCLQGKETYFGDNKCKFECLARYRKAACSCYPLDYAVAINETDSTNICHKGFNYSTAGGGIKSVNFGNLGLDSEDCWFDDNLDSALKNCYDKCVNPCTIWTYDFTTSVTKMAAVIRSIGKKSMTSITIQYPSGSDIIVMTEINSQTFDSFVANVGGLLGIWTGASIVSFIQFFYLCCCANSQQKSWFPFWKFNDNSKRFMDRKIHDVIVQ